MRATLSVSIASRSEPCVRRPTLSTLSLTSKLRVLNSPMILEIFWIPCWSFHLADTCGLLQLACPALGTRCAHQWISKNRILSELSSGRHIWIIAVSVPSLRNALRTPVHFKESGGNSIRRRRDEEIWGSDSSCLEYAWIYWHRCQVLVQQGDTA